MGNVAHYPPSDDYVSWFVKVLAGGAGNLTGPGDVFSYYQAGDAAGAAYTEYGLC